MVQPYKLYESQIHKVVVGPSKVHGLGVFALGNFNEGDTVCLYGGLCVHCAISSGRYMLDCDYFNHQTHTLEKWYLDAENPQNACGRWVNDSVGTEWQGIYNVRVVPRLSKRFHFEYGTYTVEIVATTDIRQGEELFMDYGAAYWSRFSNYKGMDPNIPTGSRYEQIMKYYCKR